MYNYVYLYNIYIYIRVYMSEIRGVHLSMPKFVHILPSSPKSRYCSIVFPKTTLSRAISFRCRETFRTMRKRAEGYIGRWQKRLQCLLSCEMGATARWRRDGQSFLQEWLWLMVGQVLHPAIYLMGYDLWILMGYHYCTNFTTKPCPISDVNIPTSLIRSSPTIHEMSLPPKWK